MHTFVIKGEWVTLNEYINAERTNRFMAAKIKREEMERIMWQIPAAKITGKVHVSFQAIVKDRKKDPDNIYTIFTKFFLDSLTAKGIIEDDSQKYIASITFQEVLIGDPEMRVMIMPRLPDHETQSCH